MNNIWTTDEIQFLNDNYTTMGNKELSKYLSGRTTDAIKAKMKDLKLKREPRKYTFQDVINAFKNTDYELVSTIDDYIDSGKPTLRYYCPRHRDKGVLKISLSHLLHGEGCIYCGREKSGKSRLLDLSDDQKYKDLCQSKGFIYDQTIRENGKVKIQFYCPKHIELGSQKNDNRQYE